MVVEHDPVVDVEQGDDHRRGIDHRLDQRFLIPHLRFQAVEFGDVAMHAEIVEDLAAGIGHRRNAQLGKVLAAVLAPIDQTAAPRLAMRNRLPEALIELARHAVVGDDRLVLANHLITRVTGNAAEGRIDVEDVALRIGDRDCHVGLIDRVLEDLWVDARRQRIHCSLFACGRCPELFAGHCAPPCGRVSLQWSRFRAALDSTAVSVCSCGVLSVLRQKRRLSRAARPVAPARKKRHAGADLATLARLWCAVRQTMACFVQNDGQGACRQ